ncbi:hypothetical protein [Roseibium alexandrii]|uniref:Uncharacterized protein n=1 Tax=Roseibium alexandrii (strain DSM 17067 / NCIMB 14079 / DFL-11) TaxID=244592 RepID=A0A5E8GZV6_ROSAD|nr:hypothetical protein [Roseibium alexandrii]EEE45510.1 hypothetical protein SADFL11_2799 [Roseibium alexandrii DFL-11]
MKTPPTLADWQRDPACIDRYLAGLDTLEVLEMGEGTLRCLSDFLFDAARKKVLSSISLTASSVRSASGGDRKTLDALRAQFLAEAALFETAGRFFRAEVNRRDGPGLSQTSEPQEPAHESG